MFKGKTGQVNGSTSCIGLGIAKALAAKGARSSVTCIAICPGWVLTPWVQKQLDDLAKAGNSGST